MSDYVDKTKMGLFVRGPLTASGRDELIMTGQTRAELEPIRKANNDRSRPLYIKKLEKP